LVVQAVANSNALVTVAAIEAAEAHA